MELRLLPPQLDEIWAADEPTALGILARLASQLDYESDLRQSIYVDFLREVLAFCKDLEFSTAKTFVAFEVMVDMHAQACGQLLSKEEAFALWSKLLMERITALPAEENMTLAEVQALTAHVNSDYFSQYALHQHVFTQGREGERRRTDLFVQLAAVPPPLAEGTPVVHAPAADESAPAADSAHDGAPAAAPAAAAPATSDEQLDTAVDAAIAKLVEDRVEAARVALAAQFDEREAELTQRIATLELAVDKQSSSRPGSRPGIAKKK